MVALASLAAQGFYLSLLVGQGPKRQPVSVMKFVKVMRGLDFYLLFLNMFAWNFGGLMSFVFLGDLARGGGIEKNRAALLVSMVGFTSVSSCLGLGVLTKYVVFNEFFTFALGCIMRGTAMILFPLQAADWWYLVLWTIVSGIGYGINIGMIVPTFLKVYPIEEATFAFSLTMVACGAGSLGGPPLAGRVNIPENWRQSIVKCKKIFNLFTTIHDGNFRRHSSMNVTIK